MSTPENRNENRKRHTLPDAAKPYQFKPGQSGNPGGRPKRKPLTEAYERILSNPAEANAIAKAMIRLARKGNVRAAQELADRTEGKAIQAMDISGDMSVDMEIIKRLEEGRKRLSEASPG